MGMNPALAMMLLGGNKRPPSEYSDNGRRMIGFERGYDPMDNRYYPRPERMEYGGGKEGNTYGDIYARGTIYAPGAMNKPSQKMRRYEDDDDDEYGHKVDEHKARKWVKKMSSGEHFKPEQAEQLRTAHAPNCDKWEFYTALNAMYSDYHKTAQKMGVDKPEFYVYLAKDFLDDEDAGPDKLYKYMTTIPE